MELIRVALATSLMNLLGSCSKMSDTLLMKSGVLALQALLEGLKALSTTARGSLVSFSCCLISNPSSVDPEQLRDLGVAEGVALYTQNLDNVLARSR
ncbi:Hypothetical protein FKW44_024968 [Caligus rogercresseyi]|uniref:Uncharacterized protein n=1 Tax=Caligus rogercresseyi TaxID=217165 RepID=A0A7T8GL11_CALRO|nr:Hypothetical protein FKW44_024968 [Caligus rogercresseyi]